MNYRLYVSTLLFLFLHFQTFGQSPKLVRGPYLQVLTPTSVVVRWRTDQPTTGRVWFGPSAGQLTASIQETEPTLNHVLTIKDLQPATTYAYAIGYDDTQLASGPDYYVKTAVPAGDTRPLRFWVLGDFGSGTDNQKNVYQAFRNATATHPSDLWIWLGDNAYSFGLEQEYQDLVFAIYPPSLRNLPLFITPGNHDYADSHTNRNIPYYNLFSFPTQGESGGIASGSKSYFAADYGNVHLISLDSQANQEDGFRLYDTTSVQVQWLKRDLAATKLPWKIVVFHHPPYSKGGHNSDTEEQMKLIRENLTPILERYGVDLVLSGHSHGYERTYRLKGLRGLANTFDKSKHVAESTTGRYDGSPNSCPILTKGEGVVYVVNGSGGQLGGQSPDFPHPGTVYNNVTLGGSMLLDVRDNRLDAQLIMSDGSVPDRFTILKNVNKTIALNAQYGDTLQLTASWPSISTSSVDVAGAYRWPGGKTTRSIPYVIDQAGSFSVTVSDDKNCLIDDFRLTVPQPKLTAKTSVSACVGSSLDVTAVLENITKGSDWQYDVWLSDAKGSFAGEQRVGSGKLSGLKALIPANLPAGSGYRLQVRPRDRAAIEPALSNSIELKAPPTATLTGSATITQGESFPLSVTFTGVGPWRGTLSDGTTFSGAASPTLLTIKPQKSAIYTIASVENSCGKGTASGQAIVTLLVATGSEEIDGGQLRIYPNPTHDVLHLELILTQKRDVSLTLVDTQGRLIFQKQAGLVSSLSESITMPHAPGTYLLNVQVGNQTLTRKVVRQ